METHTLIQIKWSTRSTLNTSLPSLLSYETFASIEKDGKMITPDEYLENALALPTGNRPVDHTNRMILSAIRDSFPSKKCFVMQSPVDREDDL